MRVSTVFGLLVAVIGLLLSGAASAALTMSVDRNPVALNESFTLTLSSDESLSAEPDFSHIDRLFEVVSRRQSSNYQMINGDVSRSLNWTMVLLPRSSGTITIPPVRAGAERSNGLTLEVKEQGAAFDEQAGEQKGEALLLRVETSEGPLYVQQQLLYTIRIYLALDAGVQIANGSSLTEPELSEGEAVIKRLGDDVNYRTEIDGRRYSVIERRYALYPQQSGPLTIAPVRFNGRLVESGGRRQSIFGSLNQPTRIRRIASQGVTREVKPVPAAFNAHHWLPASRVVLSEEATPERMVVGEPITRTVTLQVEGLTSAQLPALEFALPDGVKSYPDQPQLEEQPSKKGITALRREKVALVASEPGALLLPALELKWWNTVTGRQEVARLPQRRMVVEAAAGEPVAAVAPAPQQPQVHSPVGAETSPGVWPLVSLLLGLGWGSTLLLWWRSSRQSAPEKTVAAPKLSELSKAVKQACKQHQPQAAREALLQWAQGRWPQDPPLGLDAIAARSGGALADEISRLNQHLYGKGDGEWRGDALWKAFKQQQPDESSSQNEEQLQPLFRHQQH